MEHKWDKYGERCLNCGDKDWFAGRTCSSTTPSGAPRIVPDSECKFGKCAYTTTGCVGECKGDQITGGAVTIVTHNSKVTGAPPNDAKQENGK